MSYEAQRNLLVVAAFGGGAVAALFGYRELWQSALAGVAAATVAWVVAVALVAIREVRRG
jgi:uncharacterized membrane protein YagU involved in acid resistance